MLRKKSRKSRKSRRPNSRVIIAAVVFVLVAAGVAGWQLFGRDKRDSTAQEAIDYSDAVPTEDEERAGDEQKQRIDEEAPAPQPDPGNDNKQDVRVVITDASQYGDEIEVRAYVPDSYEEGACTVVFTKGEHKVEKTVKAFVDSSYTICPRVTVPRSEFPAAGAWSVTVAYSSAKYSGAANQNMEIQ